MKRFFLFTLLFVFAACFLLDTQLAVSAQRFSGGRSLGRQHLFTSSARSSYGAQRPSYESSYNSTHTPPPSNAPTSNRTHWAIPALGGFAAGVGTAALVSHLSNNNAPATAPMAQQPMPATTSTQQPLAQTGNQNNRNLFPIIILIIVIIAAFFLMRRALNKNTSNQSTTGSPNTSPVFQPVLDEHTAMPRAARFENLLGESESAFLEKSKTLFLAVQKAFDTRDKALLEKLVTQDIFEEMSADLNKQPDGELTITMLQATLRNVVEENHTVIASVYFHGLIRESEQTTHLSEVWHLAQKNDRTWIVEGISQEPEA